MNRVIPDRISLVLSGGIVAVALAGCGSSSPSSTAHAAPLSVVGGHAVLGHLEISRAYIPAPATPSLGAAYLTVTNSGAADRLISVTTSAFRRARLNRYERLADGAEAMVPLIHGGVVPAHGRLVLMPGGYHIMLSHPRHHVRRGAMERMTLRFQRAGVVSLAVPVVAATGLPGSSGGEVVPGMSMSGGSM